MGIFQADVYCDYCIEEIKRRLIAEGVLSTGALKDCDPDDERSFDSDDFPKGGYPDDEETDFPQHCGSGAGCLNALILSDGRKYGQLLGTNLTSEGADYVREAVAEAQAAPRACRICKGAGVKDAPRGTPGYCGHCNGVPLASGALECWREEFSWIDFTADDDDESEEGND